MSHQDRYPLAYCTNVHAGASFAQMLANLRKYAPRVQELRSNAGPMGLGLWFSHRSVVEAGEPANRRLLREWLDAHSMIAFTANAFPQLDFHQPVVKHAVYQPDWTRSERTAYTLQVFALMHELVAAELELSVSTVPLGWPRFAAGSSEEKEFFRSCAHQLWNVCRWLEQLERTSGRLAYLCLEPEPGCVLDSSADVVRFFEDWLRGQTMTSDTARRYLRVCHDICHSAVMFEPQSRAIGQLRDAGIKIGKVQISAALEANFGNADPLADNDQWQRLRQFAEPKFLHQTVVRRGDRTQFFEDLPTALGEACELAGSQWRVHFHMPLFIDQIGGLRTTNFEIREFLDAAGPSDLPRHLEIETYAWSVLPNALATDDLASGIAREFDWFTRLRPAQRS